MTGVYYPNNKENAFMKTFAYLLVVVLFSFLLPATLHADVQTDALEEYRSKGLQAQQKGFLEEARAYYEKALMFDQYRADIYNDLGVVCERMGNDYEAKNYYFKALTIDPEYLPAYSNLAYFYKREGNLTKAIEYFKKRMELGGPMDPWSKEAADQLKALSNASPELKQWLKEYEVSVLARETNILTQKVKEQEEKSLRESLAKADKSVREAKAYEEKDMYGEALAQYDTALAATPGNPRIIEYRQAVLVKMKQEEVEKLAQAALEKLKAGDAHSSREDFRQILTIIPDE